MTVCEFRAVTECPSCGHIATHWIEQPPQPQAPKPPRSEHRKLKLAWWDGPDIHHAIQGIVVHSTYTSWTHLTTETCSIIRECRTCNHKWGEQ